MKKLIRRFKRLPRKKKILVVSIIVILLAALIGGILFALREDEVIKKKDEPTYSQLQGIEVDEEIAERPVLAIMIENSEEARPQAGLSSASIVFESVTEGGITRYLTMFQEDIPKDIAPVRSVRPYFVDWLMGFDASVAHVGGSEEALQMLANRDESKSLNQFSYPEPYYRGTERAAPHNMHVKTKDLQELQETLEHETSEFDEIPRSKDKPAKQPDATQISINYSSPTFAVGYEYRKKTNDYIRLLAGEEHIDANTDKPITTKNVILIKMKGDGVHALGKGEAVVFKDGKAIEGRWEQTKYTERIKLYDKNDKEIKLNRGKTWFAVLPSTGTVDYQAPKAQSSQTEDPAQ